MRCFLLLCLMLSGSAQAGKVYTWTDERGVVHYTDRPVGPDGAAQVPGMEVGARGVSQGGASATVESLQGTWCEYEMATASAGGETILERVEWTFKGSRLTYHDLNSNVKVVSRFSIKDDTILTDQASMGNHKVRSFGGDLMELGGETVYYRLRRGPC